MVKIQDMMELGGLQEEVNNGNISKRKHPECDLYILNYTPKTQLNWDWNAYTINCRGLIVDGEDNVIARPFKKFFTLEQWRELRNKVHHLYGVKYKNIFTGPHDVHPKIDGSLGILYYNTERKVYEVATRGSFTSEQAIRGTQILQEKYPQISKVGINPNHTFLFEIVYPENRIVVDYGDTEDLFLLGVVDNISGRTVHHFLLDYPFFSCFKTSADLRLLEEKRVMDDLSDGHHWKDLESYNLENREGFVVHFWRNDVRVKIKFEDYKNIHKLINYMTPKHIIELIRQDKFSQYVMRLGHLSDKALDISEKLIGRYEEIREMSKDCVEYNSGLSRKEFALKYKVLSHASVMFNMLDGKDCGDAIWKVIKKEMGI